MRVDEVGAQDANEEHLASSDEAAQAEMRQDRRRHRARLIRAMRERDKRRQKVGKVQRGKRRDSQRQAAHRISSRWGSGCPVYQGERVANAPAPVTAAGHQ